MLNEEMILSTLNDIEYSINPNFAIEFVTVVLMLED